MANWKKVIVSGSDAELSNLTVTDLTTGASTHKVVVSDGGVFKQVDQSTVAGAAVAFESASFVGVDAVSGGNLNDFDDTTGIASTNPGAIVFVTGSAGQNINFKMSASSDSTFIHLQAVTHSVVGTANQVTVSTTSGVSTLSTPQNINTSATPTFANITINGATNTASFVSLKASGVISSSQFQGNGSGLTGITSDTATEVTVTNNPTEAATHYVTFVDGNSGAQGIETDSADLTYNPSTGNLSATKLTGTIQTAAQTNITSVGALGGGSISSNFGNIDNSTGNSTLKTNAATVTHLSSSGGITGSGLEIKGDGHFTGNIAVDSGQIFGANGFGIQIDSITSTSGSSAFGTGSAGDIGSTAEATHTFTGSIYATGSIFDFDGPISASAFSGDGSGLTNLDTGNLDLKTLTMGHGLDGTATSFDATTNATIDIKLDAGTLTKSAGGLKVADAGIGTDQLANDAVTNDKLADMTRGFIKVGNSAGVTADMNAKSSGYILIGDGSDIRSQEVTGDVTINGSAVTSIGADKVNETHLSESIIRAHSPLTTGVQSGDKLLIYEASHDVNKSVSIASFASYLNDPLVLSNLAANTQYTLEGSAGGTNTAVITLSDGTNNDSITFAGTTDEIAITEDVTDPDNSTITIGLPDDVTIGSDLTVTATLTVNGNVTLGNHSSDTVTIAGDLIVQGNSTTINTTELVVEDQFILLSSGSRTGDIDGGILVQEGATSAYVLGVKASDDRWALQKDLAIDNDGTVTSFSANDYLVTTKNASGAPSGNPTYGDTNATRAGQLYIDTATNDIYIYA